ncbi:DNA-binding transcriptional regulator, LysR family [Candidatus Hydrogenisulfobacillus filiaventi]|uniref:DNA-binding transcriptional regulator, LysR family n=1 Tax=Candidatus Hydrogenisulfobacillus filiaventi TaxID=2707344 RepID=A0A6F8ZDI2_9FIRM|nr:LysR family transcriptional regulator [Bacillota bacterium]CAB1127991.1 DNA-binding transcriptional regulator, LysR family [Candidatus Hydrogenisulfobacillus filiaventi]
MIQNLRTFVRVVEAGSLTRAAGDLHLSQPAVTKQLQALEAEFGSRLLVREHHRVRPTLGGEALYRYARRLLALYDQARAAVAELEEPGRGEVAVGAVSTVALYTLPPVLLDFSRRYPQVRLHVRIGDIAETVQLVRRGEVGLALVTVPVEQAGLLSVPLFDDPVRLVAAPARARHLPRPLEAAALSELEFISYQTPSRFRSFVDGMLEQRGIIPAVRMEFNSHEAVKGMVKAGLGVAMVPESVVREDLARGELVALEVQGLPPLVRTTSLLLPREGEPARLVAALAETVLEHFGVRARLPWAGGGEG